MSKQSNGKAFPPLGGLKVGSIDLDALLGGKRDTEHMDASWAEVDPNVVHSIIWAVSYLGGTAQFGVTKNNRAYTLKLYIKKPFDPIYWDGNDAGRAEMADFARTLTEACAGTA